MQQVRDQPDSSLMAEITRRYKLPDDVEVSIKLPKRSRQTEPSEQALVFTIPNDESQGNLINNHLPGVVQIAADLECGWVWFKCLDKPPSKILKFETRNVREFLDEIGDSI